MYLHLQFSHELHKFTPIFVMSYTLVSRDVLTTNDIRCNNTLCSFVYAGFAECMLESHNLISPVPLERWDSASVTAPLEVVQSNMLRFAAFAADVASFDETFFRLSRTEAAAMDPQARMLLTQVAAAQQVQLLKRVKERIQRVY